MQRDFSSLPYDVRIHQLLAIKIGLSVYAKHGLKVNRDYTPKAMLMAAGRMTGAMYKMGDFLKAADDLEKLCVRMKKEEDERVAVARILAEKSPSAEVH